MNTYKSLSWHVDWTGEQPRPAFTVIALLVVIGILAISSSPAKAQPGSVDLTFDAGELTGSVPDAPGWTVIEDMALLGDGRLYIGGHLNSVQGVFRDGIARLLPNGLLDPAFEEHEPADLLEGDVHHIFLENGGNILAGAWCVRRFRADGAVDDSLTNCPNVIGVQADGKLLVIADQTSSLIRLFPDGSDDPGFSSTVAVDDIHPKSLLMEADGRILMVTLNSAPADSSRNLIRLLANGQVDSLFRLARIERNGEDFGGLVGALARQPDGKYLVGGQFRSLNGSPRNSIARIHPDGTLDEAFDAKSAFASGRVLALAIQPDGKILVGGHFFDQQSASKGGLVRLKADGDLDTSFSVGAGAWVRSTNPGTQDWPGYVKRVMLQPDGRILVSGDFNEFDGVRRQYIVRLNGDSPLLRLGIPQRGQDGTIQLPVFDFTGRTTIVEAATGVLSANWQPIWTNTISTTSFTAIDRDSSGSSPRFYRALAR